MGMEKNIIPIFATENKNNKIYMSMEKKNLMGATAQKPEVQSKVVVYYVASKFSYATEVKSIEFSNKENADTFINLMKDEGYEITQFAGEGYLGEEAEQEKMEAEAKAEISEAVDAFILNNYGFLKGTDEYDFIYPQIFGLMQSYGYVDRDGDVVDQVSFINFLSYDQFRDELKSTLVRYMDWLNENVEFGGGKKINLFINCE